MGDFKDVDGDESLSLTESGYNRLNHMADIALELSEVINNVLDNEKVNTRSRDRIIMMITELNNNLNSI